jgi:hypothetical protein
MQSDSRRPHREILPVCAGCCPRALRRSAEGTQSHLELRVGPAARICVNIYRRLSAAPARMAAMTLDRVSGPIGSCAGTRWWRSPRSAVPSIAIKPSRGFARSSRTTRSSVNSWAPAGTMITSMRLVREKVPRSSAATSARWTIAISGSGAIACSMTSESILGTSKSRIRMVGGIVLAARRPREITVE